MKPEDHKRQAFEQYRDQRNKELEQEGHNPGSKFHVTNAHYATWEAACAHRDAQPFGEPVAYVFPSDLERFKSEETFAQAYSIPCGNPTEKTVPLYREAPAVAVNEQHPGLLWALYHHQGGISPVGQPIRAALGIGQHDRLTDEQIAKAKQWAEAAKGGV
jgi:hypothetical protein